MSTGGNQPVPNEASGFHPSRRFRLSLQLGCHATGLYWDPPLVGLGIFIGPPIGPEATTRVLSRCGCSSSTFPALPPAWSAGARLLTPRHPHHALARLCLIACLRAQVFGSRPAHATASASTLFHEYGDGILALAFPQAPHADRHSSSQVCPPRPNGENLTRAHYP